MTAPATGELAIEAYGLGKRYGDRTVVDGVSFTAAPGRVLALLGAAARTFRWE